MLHLALAAAMAPAQPQPLRATQVAPGCYVLQGAAALGTAANRNFIANAAFVVTSEGVVVIDALGSPPLSRTGARMTSWAVNGPAMTSDPAAPSTTRLAAMA